MPKISPNACGRLQEGQHPLTGQRAANFRLLANKWAERRLVTQWRHGCRTMRRRVCNAGASNAGRSLCVQISRERSDPSQYIDTTWKAIDCATTCRWQFLYNETFQQTFRPLLSKLSKRRQIYPHLEQVRGGVEPWLMARWKGHVDFVLSVIELLFLSLTVEALQDKMYQNSLPSGGGRSLGAKISGGRGHPWGIFFGFYKLDAFCYLIVQTAPCYLPLFWHNTGVLQTDRRTHGRNCRS